MKTTNTVLVILAALACHDRSRAPTALGADVAAPVSAPAPGTPVVLRGTILTPDGVIEHGYVAIADGRIISVSNRQPDIPDALRINTAGVILPGFVDLHNHVPFASRPAGGGDVARTADGRPSLDVIRT